MGWEGAITFNLHVFTCLILSSLAKVNDLKPNLYTFELKPNTESQRNLLRSLYDEHSYAFLNNLDTNSKIDLLVAPEEVLQLEQKLSDVDIKFRVFRSSDQTELEMQPGEEYNWNQYHKLNDTYNWLRSLSKLYSQQASLFVAGKSYEGRDLLGIKISYGVDKKAIFIEGGIHAREWISPATATYIANQLLTSKERDVRMIAENFDWYILPHANPDGYIYTYTTDRLWRKSRSPQANGCYGVDLNRNWDFHWNEVGASKDPCDNTYAGRKPFSEIEVRTLANYINKLKDKLFLYVGFHSFYKKLLYPYAYTPELPTNNFDYKRVYDATIAGLKRRYGNKYTGGYTYDSMYPASGTGMDWVYAIAGINYSFVYELCPLNADIFGFTLPADRIIPTGKETLDSIVEMVKEASVDLSLAQLL